ncbi:MAG: CPBP family intramembrane glutamic endopeptidase [Candidatus Magasanikiibacteriota bacterium]
MKKIFEVLKIYFFCLLFSMIFGFVTSQFTDNHYVQVLLYCFGLYLPILLNKKYSKENYKTIKVVFPWIIIITILPFLYLSPAFIFLSDNKIKSYLENFSPLSIFLTFIAIAVYAFFEETVWRGYFYDKLYKIGWLKMNILIGFLWAVWHYPAIIYGTYISSFNALQVLIFTINIMLLNFIFSTIRRKNSLTFAILIHASYNIIYNSIDRLYKISWNESSLFFTFSLLVVIIFFKFWKKPPWFKLPTWLGNTFHI